MMFRRREIGIGFSFAALVGAVLILGPYTTASLTQDNGHVRLPAITPAPRTGTMLFVGDIMLSRAVGDAMARRDDWTWPFALIASVTADADLMFGNLETTISERGTAAGCRYCFRADPQVVTGLVAAGFDALSVANNHIWDYGPEAFVDTLAYLSDVGIDAVGGGMDARTAAEPVVVDVNGTRVALLAYTNLLHAGAAPGEDKPGANRYDAETVHAAVADAAARADVVVVSFHAGQEYRSEPTLLQRHMYEAIIDAGADLVIGHHPHVIEPLERYEQGWIAYSLGNFVFDQSFSEETMTGSMLRVQVTDGDVVDVTESWVSISEQYQASLLPESEI